MTPEDDRPNDRTNEFATDFASLKAAEVDAPVAYEPPKPREIGASIEKISTDFQSLRKEIPIEAPRFVRMTLGDNVIAALSPIFIYIMVTSIIWFLLDARYVFTETSEYASVNDTSIRIAATMFILGVVALNRLIARDGTEESFLYAACLAGVVALFTLAMPQLFGSGSFSNSLNRFPAMGMTINLSMTFFIWWLTNRLTHECCVDENRHAGDLGILTGAARNLSQSASKPSAWPQNIDRSDLMNWSRDFSERKGRLTAADRLPRRHPGMSIFYFSIPAMIIFSLGQRVLLSGGESMLMVGHVYVGLYTVSALLLLMLTSLGGLRQYFRRRRMQMPPGIAPYWVGLGAAMVVVVMAGATRLPMPSLPKPAYIAAQHAGFGSANSKLHSLVATPAEILSQTTFQRYLGYAVLAFVGITLAYAALRWLGAQAAKAARSRNDLPQWMTTALKQIDRGLQKALRLPALPRLKPRPKVQRAIALSARYTNPLGDVSRAASMSNADMIAYAYDALCALATDMGAPRLPSQTPYEFAAALPDKLRSLHEETKELTELLVRTSYAGEDLDDRVRDRLRRFWISYERVRSHAIR
ncbi:MAG TPA: DUF4129 domain-containing protein [Candidatus Hydrogenedentes bacterium]|nr:DUF4129 domain-containing protein [Candidatus Hydrogenedentota bacterium]